MVFHEVLSLIDAFLFWYKLVDSSTVEVKGEMIGVGLPTEFVLEMKDLSIEKNEIEWTENAYPLVEY